MPHLIISDEQIEGIVRFYAASATCQGDKLKWTPTCQGTNCGARMFPGFLLNLSLFLSPALGATFGWPSQSRLRRASSPKGGAKSRLPPWGRCHAKGMTERATRPPARTCTGGSHRRGVQPPVSPAGSVGSGRSPLGTRTPVARIAQGATPAN